jgi:ADP-ribosylglycohydrolase
MDRYAKILGCLLGTAVGDAVGLKREGLSKKRARRLYGVPPLKPGLLLNRGYCSDDTEHTQMVGRALVISKGDPQAFEKQLTRELKRWLLTMPAGVGLATLRSCLKLLSGFSPQHSGVYSAGNGPAMRSALLGLCASSADQLQELVHCCTRITHTDPRAEQGALLVAQAARLSITAPGQTPLEFLRDSLETIQGDELRHSIDSAVQHLERHSTPEEYAQDQGWNNGVTGYINQTVPAALYCWAYSADQLRESVENAVMLGGDTDSVAAITGAICGANLGAEAIPAEWKLGLSEWPRTVSWMEDLADRLSQYPQSAEELEPPPMHWLATIPRNLVFALVVLTLGSRRLFPPY